MAVKPITNKQAVRNENINRAKQVSTRNLEASAGNSKRTVLPGKNLNKNYAITLKDVDTSILSFIKNVMRPSIRESNEVIKVPVMYGNEERWKAAR